MSAYDMSQYMRLIQVDGGRVTGMFKVTPHAGRASDVHVTTHEVTLWYDDNHSAGRVLHSDALTAKVKDGEATLMFCRSDREAEIRHDWEHFAAAIEAAAAVFPVASSVKPDSTAPATGEADNRG